MPPDRALFAGTTVASTMSDRDAIRRDVLKYVGSHQTAVSMGAVAQAMREKHVKVRDSDVRSLVQPMIVTGKLSYAPGLKIKLGAVK